MKLYELWCPLCAHYPVIAEKDMTLSIPRYCACPIPGCGYTGDKPLQGMYEADEQQAAALLALIPHLLPSTHCAELSKLKKLKRPKERGLR
jgi:hypothetical protein